MSLPPDSLDEIPAETARIAQRSFPHGSTAICLRDQFGRIYHDGMFADLYPVEGQPALAPWRLALVTVLQYVENLTDRQAADAVRGRLDWKYALALPVDHPGFDASVLSTFRDRLVAGDAAERLLWAVLEVAQEQGLLRTRGRLRTDSTRVLAAVRTLNRVELVGETLRTALDALALAAPEWLVAQVPAAWGTRYARRMEADRLPAQEAQRQALVQQIGEDGVHLLTAVRAAAAPPWLRNLHAVQVLAAVWAQQYEIEPAGVRWRPTTALPPAGERILSPHDLTVRYGEKRRQGWVGSVAQITETCEEDLPHLVVQARSTAAHVSDQAMTAPLWDDLAARDLLPGTHFMDTGYLDAAGLVDAATREIDLVGPVQPSSSWQARAGTGYAAADFHLNWDTAQATCPTGRVSQRWWQRTDSHGAPVIEVRFASSDCRACPVRAACTRSATGPRTLMLLPTRTLHEARQAALARQETATFREQYHCRAGIEGTISQLVHRTGGRQARYRGQAKLQVQVSAEAAAISVLRLVAW